MNLRNKFRVVHDRFRSAGALHDAVEPFEGLVVQFLGRDGRRVVEIHAAVAVTGGTGEAGLSRGVAVAVRRAHRQEKVFDLVLRFA